MSTVQPDSPVRVFGNGDSASNNPFPQPTGEVKVVEVGSKLREMYEMAKQQNNLDAMAEAIRGLYECATFEHNNERNEVGFGSGTS